MYLFYGIFFNLSNRYCNDKKNAGKFPRFFYYGRKATLVSRLKRRYQRLLRYCTGQGLTYDLI